ncbi:hypothetical protein B0H13DRAFT_2262959 [Mycena leptocephala]|nr:hypothetical protein B0H13DRAFT_2262959 [Mycena leptocephala]
MSLSVTEFPQDILLELAKRLDVADLLSLLSLCRITRELQFERTLWINALIHIREVEMQPLPVSPADSVDTLSLPELQNIVRRVDRLMKNFKSEKPRPFHMGNFPWNARPASSSFQEPTSWWPIPTKGVALCTEIKGKALIGAWIDCGFCTPTDIVSWTMNADAALQTTPDAFTQALPRDIFGRMRAPCLAFGKTLYLFFARQSSSNPQYGAFHFLLSLPSTFNGFHPIFLVPTQHRSVHPMRQRFAHITLVSTGELTIPVCSRPITEFLQ